MKDGDIIIFDNENGQVINLPYVKCLLHWNKNTRDLFPEEGTYWATGTIRKATKKEIRTVQWGNES